MLHGGQFHVYYSHSHTTHIIANNLPNSKIQELRDQKVVRPEWITDSIKAGHLLSYLQYQLYAKQKGLSFPSVSVHQGQEPAGPLHGRHLPSHSLNNHNPTPSLGQPLSRHHTPTSSHSHLHTDNLHPQPKHYNPLASHRSPQPSHSLPSLSAAPGPQSCILHVDMDCFFVSVGIRHRPDLKGKSVAVTSNHGSGRVAQRPGVDCQLELQCYHKQYSYPAVSERKDGDLEEITSSETESHISHGNSVDQDTAALSMAEIASCSYEARQAGVRNGMFFGQAKQLCPSLQSVPYDFQAYKKVALAIYSHDIEALSCDEALVDSSALLAELSVTPDELASAIRADVRERTGCSASVGSNILLARMATRKAKPNGQYLLRSEEVDDFIRDQTHHLLATHQPHTQLLCVGRSMGGKLASLGVRSCGDLQQEFGPRTGQTLFRFCRGLDDRPVRSEKERKSVSAEMNFNIRFTQVDEAESFLTHLSIEVQKRLQGAGLRGRRLTLKVMVCKAGVEQSNYMVMAPVTVWLGERDQWTRSVTLAQLTDCGHLIASEVIKLFHAMRLKVQDLRGVGLQVQLLEGAYSFPKDPTGPKTCYVRDKLLAQHTPAQHNYTGKCVCVCEFLLVVTSRSQSSSHRTTSVSQDTCCMCVHVCLCPCQVDRSVLEALPAELRERVEHSWTHRDTERTHNGSHQPLVLQIPKQSGQTGSTGIILELPDFSQVDLEVFAALPRELQEELRSVYGRRENTHGIMGKNTLENGPSTSPLQQDDPETLSKFTPCPEPTLAGACDFRDIRTLLREWITTISGTEWGVGCLLPSMEKGGHLLP
uniref:DNA repair protein REV1 n=1 Tax=Oncorhynchus kisutch TaxID=8019 RepID=A0A8C7KI86_ONCKI